MFGDRNNVLIEPPAPAQPTGSLPGGPGSEGDVHLLDRLSVLYRYRRIVLTVVVIVMIAGVVQTMTTTPEYRASARVQIDDERNLPGLSTGAEMYIENSVLMSTQLQSLRSKDLVRTIVGPLDLINVGEFNGTDATPTGFGGALSSLSARVTRPIRSLFGSTTPPETSGAPADPNLLLEDRLVDEFTARLNTQVISDSRAIQIDFVSRDPALAARAANALAQAFVDENLRRRRGSLDTTVTDLSREVAEGNRRIREAEQAMAEFRQTKNAAALANPELLQTQELAYEAELRVAEEATRLARAAFSALDGIPYDDQRIDTFPAMYQDLEVRRWKNELMTRQTDMASISQTLGENHPSYRDAVIKVQDAQAQLKIARDIVMDRLRNELKTAQSMEAVRRGNLQSVQNLRSDLGSKGIEYNTLVTYRDSERQLIAELQSQLTAASVQANAIRNNVRVLESAIAPTYPFKPDVSRNLLIALFVGIALAGVLAFGLDYLDDTIKTPEDITRKLRIPFLGLVPSVRGDKLPVLSGPVPHDFGEAYRALRTSLVFTSGGESTRIITCTSAQPLEGKTTTACNLAMVLAFGGSRVLLIDADMRRPGVHKALKISNTVGLSHLLVGQARVREAIQRTSDPNFCVMTAGRTPPNPSELLSSERMKQLIANLKQGPFDWVVIDTPPVLAVTDAVILTPLVDGVTFVLGAEMTRRRLAERAVQMLMVSRPKVVGAVLNRVNFDRNKYYYSRYYGHQYKSYYGSSSGSSVKA